MNCMSSEISEASRLSSGHVAEADGNARPDSCFFWSILRKRICFCSSVKMASRVIPRVKSKRYKGWQMGRLGWDSSHLRLCTSGNDTSDISFAPWCSWSSSRLVYSKTSGSCISETKRSVWKCLSWDICRIGPQPVPGGPVSKMPCSWSTPGHRSFGWTPGQALPRPDRHSSGSGSICRLGRRGARR